MSNLVEKKASSISSSEGKKDVGDNARVTQRRVSVQDLGLDDDDAELARKTGHKSEFAREFRSFSTFSFACSIMGLISSVATTFNTPFAYAGGPACVVWAWFLGSVMNLTLGSAIGELVSAYPSAGGLYSASGLVVPKKYRAVTAWFTGWLNFTGQIAGIAGTAYGLAQMMLAWATVISNNTYTPTTAQTFGVYAAIMIIHGAINCFPTSWLAKFTSGYVIINFGMTIIAGIVVLARTPGAEMHSGSYVFSDIINLSGWQNNGIAFLIGLQSVQFVMTDYDATAHISEEVSRAAIAAPVAIFTAVISTGILGFFLNIAFIFASGDVITGSVDTWIGGLAFAQILLDRSTRVGFLIMWPFICSVAWFVVTTAIQANARSFYAFSRDNGLPDRGFFAKINKRTGTTVNAVWLVVLLCILLGCLSFINYTAVLAIFSLAALGMDLSYMIPIICRQIFANHPDVQFEPGPFTLGNGLFAKAVNWIAIFWTLFECTILSFPTVKDVDANSMNWGSIVMFGVLIIVGVWYAVFAHKTYKGPRSTLSKDMLEKLGVVVKETE